MNYTDLRLLADSWGLVVTIILFLLLIGWAFRRGSRKYYNRAANMIFDEDDAKKNGSKEKAGEASGPDADQAGPKDESDGQQR